MITLEKTENNKIDNCISCNNRLHEVSIVIGNQKIRICNECLKEFILSYGSAFFNSKILDIEKGGGKWQK